MIMSMLSIILPAVSLPIVRAAPWHNVYARQSNPNDNNNNNNNNTSGGLSSSVWIPVVFIGGLFLLAAVWVLQRRMGGGSTVSSENPISVSTADGQTRELTAADLAGGARPVGARRQRRPRRTPSQVSTRSLPAYMKEPGDNEVVIYRGLEDMDEEPEGDPRNAHDSMTMTPDTTMDTTRTDRDSHEDTRSLLLPRTDSPELMRRSINMSRASHDHHGSDDSHAQLIDVQRGEAPAYETIDLNATDTSAPAQSNRESQSAGLSGFFGRFMPQRGNDSATNEQPTLSPPSNPQNSATPSPHSRQPSVQSGVSGVASTNPPESPRRSHPNRTHRNNNSSRGSVFSLFTKNHEDGPLNSPSMISLDSISSPLTHTATRTEFTYPRTGPTSEQVKFLASKETFGRFGIPYGPDAVAFAASSSRLDLPPDFNSIRPSFSDISPDPDSGSASSLRGSTRARRGGTDNNSDSGEPQFPEPTEPPPDLPFTTDQPSLSRRTSDQYFGADVIPLQSRNPMPKQKSTPTLGMGQPSLLKSALKSKSMANIQRDGDGNTPPRSVSAAGSYLTVESFQTAHDDGDGLAPSLPPALPQITVQLPSNNPSLANLAEESGSEEEEFFDGEEGNADENKRGRNIKGRDDKTPGSASMKRVHRSHAEGSNPGARDAHTYSLSTDSDSGSDNESEADTHSNNTEADKALVTTDLEARQIHHMHGGMDPEIVAIALETSSPDLTKATVEMSRTTTIET